MGALFGAREARAVSTPFTFTLTRDVLYQIASDGEQTKAEDLQRAVLQLNRSAQSFEVVRSGDDVTLAVAIRLDGHRASFRLFGSKQDYYRMAMGVRVEDTFRVIARADPSLEPVAVVREGDAFTLKLNYTWPKGGPGAAEPELPPPPEPKPAPAARREPTTSKTRADAAAQPASAAKAEPRPDAQTAYVVPARRFSGSDEPEPPAPPPAEPPPRRAPPPAAEPPRRLPSEPTASAPAPAAQPATAPEPKAPPPPPAPPARPPEPPSPPAKPPTASPPTGAEAEVAMPVPTEAPVLPRQSTVVASEGDSEAKRALERALADGSLQALVRYLEAYPDAPGAEEVRRKAETLKDNAAYERALSRDDADTYRAFLEHFPDSAHASEVRVRLAKLEDKRKRDREDRNQQALADKRRDSALQEARRLDSAKAYRVFLAAYPDAPQAAEVHGLIASIEADDAAFAEAGNTADGLDAYLAVYPKGRHTEEAKKKRQSLRTTENSDAAFNAAMAKGTAEALESFLKLHPKSARAAEARAALEMVRKGAEDSERGPGEPDSVTLIVPFAPAPTVNGAANDAAWRNAPAVDVPLTGNGHRSARLKAVHDGRNIYVLAQWADGTKDVTNRRWVWDAAKRTYDQSSQMDDGFAVALYRGRPSDACMLGGQNIDADLWLWRAQWSDLSGLADDSTLRISRERQPKSNPYPNRSGDGQVWIREEPDGGSAGWNFSIPVGYRENAMPSYVRAQAGGSRADVRAVGSWDGGTWTVEFARALDTRHADDVALREKSTQAASIAVYDHTDKGRHASSGLIRLELRGR